MVGEGWRSAQYPWPVIRRLGRGSGLVALMIGVTTVVPSGRISAPRFLGADPAGAAVTVAVPSAIDATGSRDVTSDLNAFFASVPAGATVDFPDRGRFKTEGIVVVAGARDVTILGHRSTLVAETDGASGPPPFYNYRHRWPRMRAHFEIRDSESVTVRDLAVEGPNPDGMFRPEFEAQAGFVVSRSRAVTLDRVTARATYGDGVYVTGGSVDVTVRRCALDHNGRQGVAVVDGDNVTVEQCDITGTGRSVIDLEPAHGLVRTVHIRDNRIGEYTNFLLAAVGAGEGVADVWLERNVVTGGRGVSLYVGTERSTRVGIHVIDNRGVGPSEGYEGTLMRFTRFDGIEVRGNRQRVAPGVTPIVLLNSCNETVTDNDFGGVAAGAVVKRDGDCTTGPQARPRPPTTIGPRPRLPRNADRAGTFSPRRAPASRTSSTTTTTTTGDPVARAEADGDANREENGTSTSLPALAVGGLLGVAGGVGATLLFQRVRRRRRTS